MVDKRYVESKKGTVSDDGNGECATSKLSSSWLNIFVVLRRCLQHVYSNTIVVFLCLKSRIVSSFANYVSSCLDIMLPLYVLRLRGCCIIIRCCQCRFCVEFLLY